MMCDMRNTFTRNVCRMAVALVLAFAPLAARAADDDPKPDARLEGYPSPVALNEGGAGMTWFFLIVLAGVSCGVMFMNAKRSHLD